LSEPFYKKPWSEWPFPAKAGAVGLLVWGAYTWLKSGKSENTTLDFCARVKKQNLTYDIAYYNVLADAIDAAVWLYMDGLFEDDEAIEAALLMCQNDDDVLQLICSYGIRGPLIIGLDRDLIGTVQSFLDDSNKAAVNDEYVKRGITFLWL